MTTIKMLNWDQATRAVQASKSVLIVTHMNPDGDAFGSMLGIGNALRVMGKAVDCAVDEGLPDFMAFLPGSETVRDKLTDGEWDLMISVDASDEERTGQVGAYGRNHSKTVINLDHHSTNTMFGDIFLVDSLAVSAAEVAFHWLKTMNFNFSREVSVPLLTGIVTDTLGFRTSNVTADTLKIAQDLIHYGASLTEITARTLDNKSYLVVNLWKYALASVELHEYGVVVAQVTQEDLKKAGLKDITDGGLVSFLVNVNEAMIAVVFKEQEDGTVNLSIRSKPGFDVAAVAFSLGGGGHKQAAGATIPGPLAEARKRVIPLLKEVGKQGTLVIA